MPVSAETSAEPSIEDRAAPTPLLLIDDDAMMLESLAMALEDYGFRVLTAASGLAGLRLFREQRPAAVLTDIVMPGQDGFEIMRQLRHEQADARVILISGQFDKYDYRDLAEKLGADATFAKGRDIKSLVETLNRILGR
jgi:DNA-binding response OmpR family regulator